MSINQGTNAHSQMLRQIFTLLSFGKITLVEKVLMVTFVTHKAFLWFRLKRTKRSPLSHPSSPIVAHWGRAAHDNWETSQCGCTCAVKRSLGLYSMKTGTSLSDTDLYLFSLKDHLCKRRDFNHSGTPRIPGCIGGWDGLEEKNYEKTLWFFID